jgi:catechol-2,3-dioxygenase
MRILDVVAQAEDLNALEDFYGATLALPVRREAETLRIQAGSSSLIFHPGPCAPYHFAFNLPRNQLNLAHEWLSSRISLLSDEQGQTLISFPRWNADSVYFTDPAGNILECIARHNLANDSRLPFGPSSWLCVSEAGLVVDEVAASAAKLSSELSLAYFDGQGSDLFCALGDDHGLLILVQSGRLWAPTRDRQAVACPLTLRLDGGKEISYPPLQTTAWWAPGQRVTINGQPAVVVLQESVPEGHVALWFGPEAEVWTVPAEYLQPAPPAVIRH